MMVDWLYGRRQRSVPAEETFVVPPLPNWSSAPTLQKIVRWPDQSWSRPEQEGAQMRYKPKGVPALQMILGGLPDTMRVEIDNNIGVSAKTVGELRKLTAWSGNLAVTTPDAVYPESTVKVGKASGPKRVSPKP